MAIRIPKYEPRNLATRVGNVDPGFVQSLIRNAGQDAASSTMQSLLDSGKQLGDVAIKQYVSSETARVSEALQSYRNQLADEQARYTKENQGQNALGAGEHFDAFAQETAAPLAEKFSGKFRNMFMQDAAAYGLRFKEHGQAYAQQQEQVWKRSNWEGDVAQTMDTIAADPGNAAFVQTSLQNLKGRYAEMFPGMDPRAMDADLNHKVAGITIDSFLAKDQVGQARSALNQYRDILGAAAPQFESRINTKGRELEARARADQERTQRLDAMNTARTLLNDFGGNSEQALDWINNNAKNTEQQLQYTSAYLTQRNILDAANAQRKQESTIATQNDITAKIQAAGTDVNALNTIIAEAPPEFKNFATVHAEQAVGKQRRTISDPTAWADAHSAILRGEPYDIVMGRNVGKISDPDSDKLKNLAESKAAREAESKMNLYFNSIFSRSQYAKLPADEKKQARDQLIMEAYDQTFGVNTLKERQEIIFRLLADRSVPGTFFGDFSPNTITSIKARDKDQSTVRFAVPDDAKELIKKNFAKQGEPNPSDSQISEAFELYHKQYGY